MEWGTAFTIAFLWIAGTIAVYAVLALLDRKFHFVNHKGFADLGRFLCRILITVVPPILFLAVNLLIRVGQRFGLWVIIPVLLCEILFVPAVAFVKMYLLNPKRLAAKAREQQGGYEAYRTEYLLKHKGGNEHTPAEEYVWEQFRTIAGWQGNSYRFCPESRRMEFAKAVFSENADITEGLTGWEWHDGAGGDDLDTVYILKYSDGTETAHRIYRDFLLSTLWELLKKALLLGRRRK